ncbi:unnamed protein product [Victoria cruziana]
MKFCMLVMIAVLTANLANAQDTSCLSKLASCLQYLNSTGTPSSSCCEPLKTVIHSEPVCLCSLLNSPIAGQAGINVTQAAQLPRRCGENVSASACAAISTTSTKQSSSAHATAANKMMIVLAFSAAILHVLGSV